jgi:hypothetical protein
MRSSLWPYLRVKQVGGVLTILATATFLVSCAVGRDRAEAGTVAERVHAEMRTGSFATIYNESAPRFKTVGTESEFVALMKEFQENVGQLKNANEIVYQTGLDSSIGRTHVLVFVLEYGSWTCAGKHDSGSVRDW